MRKKTAILGLLATALVSTMFAAEGRVPEGIPSLDHVFVIMMENHGFSQIVGNPDAPFANQYANFANSTTNYFAVGHPSSTNYLEIVGGSNFGVRSDNAPDWHNQNCSPNLGQPPYTTTDFPSSPNVCPIAGTGTDAETPAIDTTNECPDPTVTDPCPPGLISIDGRSIPAASNTIGKMIGDQLAEKGRRWKSYQESLPITGADGIAYSDGFFTDLSTIPDNLGGSSAFLNRSDRQDDQQRQNSEPGAQMRCNFHDRPLMISFEALPSDLRSLCQRKRESRNSERQVDPDSPLDRKRLQGDRAVGAPNQDVGADANAETYGSARAHILAGELSAHRARIGRDDAPRHDFPRGDTDIKTERVHHADISFGRVSAIWNKPAGHPLL